MDRRDRGDEFRRIRSAAGRLFSMGLSLIPCHHPWEPPPQILIDTGAWDSGMIGKRPMVAWKKYQQETASQADIDSWFGGEDLHNIAIATGPLSGLVVVDLDDPAAMAWADAALPETSLAVGTASGEHRYYRWPSDGSQIGNSGALRARGLSIDIRGDGGYVIAPGSRHANGDLYTTRPPGKSVWNSAGVQSLPDFPVAVLASSAIESEQTSNIPAAPAVDHELERRLRAYVARVDGKEHGGRNNAAFVLAANLLHDFGADPQLAWPLVEEWNQRNSPPLPERELRSTFASAERGGTHTFGWKRDLDRRAHLRLVHGAETAELGDTTATVGNLAIAADAADHRLLALPMCSVSNLPDNDGWEYVMRPSIPRGVITLLSGNGGLGKSLLACYLTVQAAAGLDHLGACIGRRFRSTVFFLEDPLSEIRRRFEDFGYIDDGSIEVFKHTEGEIALTKRHVLQIATAVERHGSDLVVIDPVIAIAAAAKVNMNLPSEVVSALGLLQDMAKDLNVAVILNCHHNSHSDTIQGGNAWSNASRSHMSVYRHPLYRDQRIVVHAKENCGEMVPYSYDIAEARPGTSGSEIVRVIGECPSWSYERMREMAAMAGKYDPGSVREAVDFLRRKLVPGVRSEKRRVIEAAAAMGIRVSDLLIGASVVGITREFVRQPGGQPDLLCWEIPVETETHSGYGCE